MLWKYYWGFIVLQSLVCGGRWSLFLFATTWQGGHVGGQYNRIFFSSKHLREKRVKFREETCFCSWSPTLPPSRANQQCFFSPLSCSFGPDMSIRWLQSLCFSLLESILISQPIMVLLFVFLNLFASYDDGFLLSGEKPEVPITRTSFLDKETFARVYEKNWTRFIFAIVNVP